MNRVVVTGAAGFLGSHVVKELLKNGCHVFAYDIVDSNKVKLPSDGNLVYKKLDVYDINAFESDLTGKDIDTFYHFAWIGSSGELRSDYNCQVNNALKTVELLKMAKRVGCKRFIFSGTIMEYESFDAIYQQGSAPQTSYIYGVGKGLAHSICKPIANDIGIELIWALVTNTYGVGELSPRLINSTIRKCINNEELNFTAGTQLYDFIYIDDVATAFYLLGLRGLKNKSYVIGSGQPKHLREYLETLIRVVGASRTPSFGSVPYTGVELSEKALSTDDLKRDCGFELKTSFEEGIRKTFEWLKENK